MTDTPRSQDLKIRDIYFSSIYIAIFPKLYTFMINRGGGGGYSP